MFQELNVVGFGQAHVFSGHDAVDVRVTTLEAQRADTPHIDIAPGRQAFVAERGRSQKGSESLGDSPNVGDDFHSYRPGRNLDCDPRVGHASSLQVVLHCHGEGALRDGEVAGLGVLTADGEKLFPFDLRMVELYLSIDERILFAAGHGHGTVAPSSVLFELIPGVVEGRQADILSGTSFHRAYRKSVAGSVDHQECGDQR